MKLDPTTIIFLLLAVTGVLGLMFLSAWIEQRKELYLRAGSAGLMFAMGLALLLARGAIPNRLSIDLANALMIVGMGVAWSAVRRFERQSAPLWLVLAGGVVWLIACTVPAFHASLALRIALNAAIAAAYSFAAAYEFLRGRHDVLLARRAMAFAFFFQGLFVSGRAIYVFFDAPQDLFTVKPVLAMLMAEPVVMIVVLAVLGVGLVREEAETHLRRSADTDALTGVLNRGAFLAGAEEMIGLARRDRRPVALLLFDLDHFKTINDRYGHLTGDLALTAFTRTVGNVVRATDVVGRIGGEEFAVLIGGVDTATAMAIAERIRFDFSRGVVSHEGRALSATVSAGIAVGRAGAADLKTLIAEADRALYDAKRAGRDRVHTAFALAS